MKDTDLEFDDSEPESGAKSGRKNAGTSAGPALYLVGTPIGNLEDITLRALARVEGSGRDRLRRHAADAEAAESLCDCDPHHQLSRAQRDDALGGTGQGDAGRGERGAGDGRGHAGNFRSGIPADCAGDPASRAGGADSGGVGVSGGAGGERLPTDSFRFSGFLPAKRGERRAALEAMKSSPRTQVFYEAPHRVVEALADICEVLGEERHVVVAREVTKLHEEFLRGRAGEVLENLKSREAVKGEITLLIGKAERRRCSRRDGRVRPSFGPAASGADHGGRESRRESGAEESGEGAGSVEERGLPGVAEEQVKARSSCARRTAEGGCPHMSLLTVQELLLSYELATSLLAPASRSR